MAKFHQFCFGCKLHWNIPLLINSAQIDGLLPRSNPFINRIFRERDTCLWTHAYTLYVRAAIVAPAYNGIIFNTILVAKGIIINKLVCLILKVSSVSSDNKKLNK